VRKKSKVDIAREIPYPAKQEVDSTPALIALLTYSQTGDAEKAMAAYRDNGGKSA
jgi:hypothetical protein